MVTKQKLLLGKNPQATLKTILNTAQIKWKNDFFR